MRATDPVELAQALVRCATVTPAAGPALDLLEDVLAGAGFTCNRLPFGEGGPAYADNLYARCGEAPPCLLLAGHVDVVPPGDPARWSVDPFAGVIADGQLWGRGAADMKTGVAAAVSAALRHLDAGGAQAGSIAFLITGDEEGPARNGTDRVLTWLEERGQRFDAAIVGEPTSVRDLGDTIKIGRRGSLNAVVEVRGRQGHTAYPQRADNAAHRLIAGLHALLAQPIDEGGERFQPSNLEVTSIDIGNPAFNVVPGAATARLNVRFNDAQTPATLEAWLRRHLEPHCPAMTLTVDCNALPFLTGPSDLVDLVAASVLEVTGRRPDANTLGGSSDARFIARLAPVVEMGLVGATMHQVDERVSTADILALTSIYEAVLRRFFGQAA